MFVTLEPEPTTEPMPTVLCRYYSRARAPSWPGMLELYFWVVALLTLGMAILSLSYLLLPSDAESVAELAATFPEKFIDLAAKLGVNADAGSNAVANVQGTIDTIRYVECGCALALCAFLVAACVSAARLVTIFENPRLTRVSFMHPSPSSG